MCMALDFANDINKKIEEARECYENLVIKEKVYNDMQQDLLHKIEDEDKFDLYTGWQFAKSLQQIREKRRKIKNEKYSMEILIDKLKNIEKIGIGDIKRSENRQGKAKYHNRQIVLKDDPLFEIKNIIENIDNKSKLTRTSATKPNTIMNDTEEKFYYVSSKVPRTKGISIKMKYKNDRERLHITSRIALAFKECKVNADKQYVDLIERK